MKVFNGKVKPSVILFNLFTILVTIVTLIVGTFTDNQAMLQEILTPEAFASLAGFMAVVSSILQKVSKPKPKAEDPPQKE